MARQVAIAADGIHHRLFRSLLTLVVVILAVAFLTNVLVEHDIARACKHGVRALAVEQRALANLAAFVDAELAPRELARRLAELPADAWMLPTLAGWMQRPPAALATLREEGESLLRDEAWFNALPPGHRRLLAGKATREEAFTRLATPEGRKQFEQAAHAIPLKLPAGLTEFAERRDEFLARLDTAAGDLSRARLALAATLDGMPFSDWLATTPSDTAEAALRDAGLVLPPAHLTALQTRARERSEERRLIELLRTPALAAAWKDAFGGLLEQQAALATLVADNARARWLRSQATTLNLPLDATLVAAAHRLTTARVVIETDERLTTVYGTREGLGGGMFWLVLVSFLVCAAGITNAMLISVIERFREIATMKCLGALNGFIARLFLLEAAFLGLVGGLFGVLLGLVIGIGRMAVSYGHWVGRFFPWADLASGALIALLCGLALTTLSALYPAFSAARMLPMEAMRIE